MVQARGPRPLASTLVVVLFIAIWLFLPGATAISQQATSQQAVAQNEPEVTAASQVQQMLDQRTAAIADDDCNKWMSFVDDQATPEFRQQQQWTCEGLIQLPIAEIRFTVLPDAVGNLATGAGLDAIYGASTYLPETRSAYRLAGIDEVDDVDTLWQTYVQRDGSWYVVSDTDVKSLGLETRYNLWDLGPITTVDSGASLVIARPGNEARAVQVNQLANQAVAEFSAQWTKPWPQKVAVVIPGSTAELSKMLGVTYDLSPFVAFVDYGNVTDDGWQATAPRMMLVDENLSQRTPEYQVRILTHELVHYVEAPLTGPYVPLWVHEGNSEWISRGRPTDASLPAGSDGKIPSDVDFATGSPSSIQLAYAEALSLMAYLANTYGPDAPVRLFENLGTVRVAPGSSFYVLDQVLQSTFGITYGQLQDAWAAG